MFVVQLGSLCCPASWRRERKGHGRHVGAFAALLAICRFICEWDDASVAFAAVIAALLTCYQPEGVLCLLSELTFETSLSCWGRSSHHDVTFLVARFWSFFVLQKLRLKQVFWGGRGGGGTNSLQTYYRSW